MNNLIDLEKKINSELTTKINRTEIKFPQRSPLNIRLNPLFKKILSMLLLLEPIIFKKPIKLVFSKSNF